MSKRPPLRPGATRRAYINRTSKPKSGGRPKPRNAKRKAKEFARCYHSKERVEYVQNLFCFACYLARAPFENHHIRGDGASRKADYTAIIPLCQRCHRLWHDKGRAWMELTFSFDADFAAACVETRWQAYCATGAAE